MKQSILDFPKQFGFEPEIQNTQNLRKTDKFIVVGMGGSALAAGILKIQNPYLDLRIHRNYGLPEIPEKELKNFIIILSSYSGNTEETIDAFQKARERDLPSAVIAAGGKLLELAKENQIPYVQIPDTGIQPRMALGFSTKALLKIIGDEAGLKELGTLSSMVVTEYEEKGKYLAEKLKGFVPIIYSSAQNYPLVLNWKVKLNETGKIPAFANVFPELNHNEMTGFDVKQSTKELSQKFYFLLLKDKDDHLRIKKRMEILEKLYKDRGLKIESLELGGVNVFYKIFACLILADWTAYFLSQVYGVEPEAVPMVEEFKKLIQR